MALHSNGTFSFRTDTVYEAQIADNVYLRIKRVNNAVAQIYFVDADGQRTDIPNEFTVYDLTNKVPISPLRDHSCFVLCCTDSYQFFVGEQIVATTWDQRQWEIQLADGVIPRHVA